MYDVVIIGAGSAGLAARKEVAKKTNNYLVVSAEPLGTTCARVGCMPSKVLIEAANIYHQNYKFEDIGVMGAENLHVNHQRLMEHVRSMRDHFVQSVLKEMDEWAAEHLLLGRAKIIDSQTLMVGEKEIRFKKLIIATGSTPVVPEQWQSLNGNIFTSDSFFEIDKMPKRLAVIGAGPMGLEIAQALARLDVEVFLFGEKENLGGLTDPEVLEALDAQLGKDLFFISNRVKEIKKNGEGFDIVAEDSSHKVDGVLLAVGRKINVEGLGLKNLQVPLKENGLPEINKKSMRVPGSNVYFAGDVAAHIPILHEAVDEGRIAGYNSVREKDEEFERRTPLAITFTYPEVAIVGRSYAQLKKEKVAFESGTVSFEKQGRAMAKLDNAGRLHIYADSKSGEILGAEIFCPSGEHIAHLLAWSMESNQDVFRLLAHPFYHPSIEEGLRTALRKLAAKLPDKDKCREFDLARCDDVPVGAFV